MKLVLRGAAVAIGIAGLLALFVFANHHAPSCFSLGSVLLAGDCRTAVRPSYEATGSIR